MNLINAHKISVVGTSSEAKSIVSRFLVRH